MGKKSQSSAFKSRITYIFVSYLFAFSFKGLTYLTLHIKELVIQFLPQIKMVLIQMLSTFGGGLGSLIMFLLSYWFIPRGGGVVTMGGIHRMVKRRKS